MKLLERLQQSLKSTGKFPWIWIIFLALGVSLAGGMLVWLLIDQIPEETGLNKRLAKYSQSIFTSTPTPFLPVPVTQTPVLSDVVQQPMPEDHPGDLPIPAPFWYEFNFSDGAARMEIHLLDPEAAFWNGRPVVLRFTPGTDCPFGTGKACVSEHSEGRHLLLTVHSGVAGEAQQLRHAIEGTSINAAGMSTTEIQGNLVALQGSIASLNQKTTHLDYLSVRAAVRIPPEQVDRYYGLPFDQALDMVASENDAFRELIDSDEGLIWIETCGWPVSGEPAAEGIYRGTGSIYLIAIGSSL